VTQFGLDSSAVLTWVLQERHWQAVDAMLRRPKAEPLLPGPVLAEVIRIARAKGNVSRPEQIATALAVQGMTVVHPEDGDLVRTAELLELSSASPGPADPKRGSCPSLSLADAMILAIVERLGCVVVTRDQHWKWLVDEGLIEVNMVAF
jgi:PIN domain nuclease of toxin-antitoxin system